jgi:hypothetical protein
MSAIAVGLPERSDAHENHRHRADACGYASALAADGDQQRGTALSQQAVIDLIEVEVVTHAATFRMPTA